MELWIEGVERGVLTMCSDPALIAGSAQPEAPRSAIKLICRKIRRRILETRQKFPALGMLEIKHLFVD